MIQSISPEFLTQFAIASREIPARQDIKIEGILIQAIQMRLTDRINGELYTIEFLVPTHMQHRDETYIQSRIAEKSDELSRKIDDIRTGGRKVRVREPEQVSLEQKGDRK